MARHFKDWIAAYVEKLSPRSEAPERYLYWSAVAAIGGALRRRCYLDMGTFKWHPNWFIVFVGPPGLVKKSTTVDTAMGLLRSVPGVNFGSDINTWEGFVTELAAAKDAYATGGADVDPLYADYEMSCATTLAISEWGMFLDPQNVTMINVLTDLWDCKDTTLRKNTKTQGQDHIVAPFVNMISATTPKWMNDNFRFAGWGFSARIIFLYAAESERDIAYPDEIWGAEMETWKAPFIEDLCQIAEMQGAMRLSFEARQLGIAWYASNKDRIKQFGLHPNADEWIAEYLNRKQTHIHKLCICLSAAQGDSLLITADHMRAAIRRCNEIEDELTKIFGSRRSESRVAKLNQDVWNGLYQIISKAGEIPRREAIRFTFRYMTQREASELIDQLLQMEFLEQRADGLSVWLSLGPHAIGPASSAAQG